MNKNIHYNSVSNWRPPARQPKQFKGLKAEEYVELSGRYAITINPEDTRDTERDTIKDFTDFREHINENVELHKSTIFKHLKFCEIELYPEVSPTGRLHWHGVLTVLNTVGFLWHDLQYIRESAQSEIDTIEDFQTWLDYIHKQEHLLKPIIREYPLIIKNKKMEGELANV